MAHPLDWYPEPDDDPKGVSSEAVDAWVESNGSESLRSIASRLESATWHPSKELAGSLVRAAATALDAVRGEPRQIGEVRKGLLAAEELFRLRGSRLLESNLLVAQRVRTEWELGRMLREAPLHKGGRPVANRSSDVTSSVSLRDLGVSKNQSSLFQRVASIDLDDLEHWMAGVVNDPDVELATTLVLDVLWREQARERRTAARVAVAEAVRPTGVMLEVADARHLPLDDSVVDLTFTSPPYALGMAYTGGDISVEDWEDFLLDSLVEVLRVTKPSGRLALNIPLDTSKPFSRPTYVHAVNAALQAGWEYRFTITWDEGNTTKGNRSLGSVNSSARPYHVSPAEMVAVFSKGEWAPSFDGKDDILPDDWQSWGREVWRLPGESHPWEGHPAPFPEALAKRVIQYLSPIGATVLDPFMGSGTTPLVAHQRGRRAIGTDISPEYVESARRRVAQ